MADKKPSGMTLTTPAASDLLFFERPADTTARYSTVAALVQSQAASLTEKGAVELATTAEAQAGSDATRAVTPAGLAAYFDQTLLAGDAFKLKIPGQTRPEFVQFYTAEALFDGVYDPVFYWGWNVNGNGSRVDATKGAIWQQFEYDYYVGGDHVMEWNFNAIDDSGNGNRYMAFLVDKTDSDSAYWWFWIGNKANNFFTISNIVTNGDLLQVYAIADSPAVRIPATVSVTGSLNGALSVIPTINSTSNGDVYGAYLLPTVSIGNGSNISSVATMRLEPPAITVNNGSTLYYPSTLMINGAPATGSYPWALWVTSGNSNFGGNLSIAGAQYDTPTDPVDIVTGTLRQRTAKTPANAGDTGRTGQICWDADYIYVCTATNTWKKVQIAAW